MDRHNLLSIIEAVGSHAFGIPAAGGTSVATQRIKTGDQIHVYGSTGMVEILT
jgi:phosphohistidine swiveling domain-containing protein